MELTKEYFEQTLKEELANVVAPLATKQDVSDAVEELARITNNGFNEVGQRFDKVEARLDGVETRLEKVEIRIDKVENRLGNVEIRIDKVENRLGNVEIGLGRVEANMFSVIKALRVPILKKIVSTK